MDTLWTCSTSWPVIAVFTWITARAFRSSQTDWSLDTRLALRASCSVCTGRTDWSNFALCAVDAAFALNTLWADWSLLALWSNCTINAVFAICSCRTGFALWASVTGKATRSNFTLRSNCAVFTIGTCRTSQADWALDSLRSNFTLRPCIALRTDLTLLALRTSYALDALWATDLTAVNPVSSTPNEDVAVSIDNVRVRNFVPGDRKIIHSFNGAEQGNARAVCTCCTGIALDTLRTLNTLRTSVTLGSLDTLWALRADCTVCASWTCVTRQAPAASITLRTDWALDALWPNFTTFALEATRSLIALRASWSRNEIDGTDQLINLKLGVVVREVNVTAAAALLNDGVRKNDKVFFAEVNNGGFFVF